MGVRNGRLLGHGGVPVWMFRGQKAKNSVAARNVGVP